MRMLKTDMSDVTKYTFLMNGKTQNKIGPEILKKEKEFVSASLMHLQCLF
jgi:hypothetical protein